MAIQVTPEELKERILEDLNELFYLVGQGERDKVERAVFQVSEIGGA